MTERLQRRWGGGVGVLAIAVLAVSGAAWAEELAKTMQRFDIPAQSTGDSLNAFSKQSGLRLLFSFDAVEGRRAGAVNGEFTAAEVLEKLLAGTGLRYEVTDDAVVLIRAGEKASSSRDAVAAGMGQSVRVAQADATNPANTDSAGASSANASAEGSAEPPGQTEQLEEIIVTAQKREERLKDVPISISVLSGDALDASSFSSVNDALRTVPGITGYENGQAGMTKFSVRGVTSNQSLFNGTSAVGYYVEEIPFAFVRYPVSPDVNAYDLERVEVLRGPQGTLYGASSLNGVVRVLTHDANPNEFELKARTTASSTHDGGESYRGDVAVNVPLIAGKLGVRAVGGYADSSGWIDLPAVGQKDVNDGVQKNLRLKVNAAPTENLGVEFLSWFSRDDRGSSPVSRDDRTAPAGFPQAVENQLDAFGLMLTYDFPAFTVLSATSNIKFSGSSLLDAPLGIEMLLTALESKLTSQEFRVNSRGAGLWKWSLGGIYRDAEDRRLQNSIFNITATGDSDTIFTSKSVAVYGELSRLFFDNRVEITGGLRYFSDESASNELQTDFPATQIPNGKKTDDFDAMTPRVIFAYRPNEQTSLYASYSQGFRSGFPQDGRILRITSAAPSIRPDRLSNYEIGAKGGAFDRRLAYDFAVYYIDWKDTIQVLTNFVGNPAAPSIFFGAVNSKGVDGFGVDVGSTFSLSDRWELGVTASWNDLSFVEDVFSGATLVYPKGSRPPESSELTAGGDISYSFPIAGTFSGRLSGSVDYVSKLLVAGPTAATAVLGDDLLRVHAGFTLTSSSGWSTMIFGDNLTDEDGRIRPAVGLLGQSDRIRPRTVGLQIDYRFH